MPFFFIIIFFGRTRARCLGNDLYKKLWYYSKKRSLVFAKCACDPCSGFKVQTGHRNWYRISSSVRVSRCLTFRSSTITDPNDLQISLEKHDCIDAIESIGFEVSSDPYSIWRGQTVLHCRVKGCMSWYARDGFSHCDRHDGFFFIPWSLSFLP